VRQIYATRAVTGRSTGPQSGYPSHHHGCHPSWSVDGSLLYHFSFRDGAFCPWVQRIDPATKRPMGPPRASFTCTIPSPGINGGRGDHVVRAGYFLLHATESTGNIWMLEIAATEIWGCVPAYQMSDPARLLRSTAARGSAGLELCGEGGDEATEQRLSLLRLRSCRG